MKTELYIHLPFCKKKCAYCDFLSFPAHREVQRQYVDALLEEIRQTQTDEIWQTREDEIRQAQTEVSVPTIFIGGGTPSVLPAAWIAEILDTVHACFSVEADAEITIEANPGSVDAEKLQVWRQAGINRISFGGQSFQEEELQLLGRIHSAAQIRESVALAREAGFANINLDLMSGLPGQTLEAWEDTLHQAIALKPEHISAYSLIIEEGTPFYEHYGEPAEENGNTAGKSMPDSGRTWPPLPDEDTERRMYERTGEILAEAGFRQYEISNYAKEGFACRHNIGYWTGVPYIGFGLGAAGFLPRHTPETGQDGWIRYKNTEQLPAYLAGSREPAEYQILTQKDLEAECMILGLRMTDGVEEAAFVRRFGHAIDTSYGDTLRRYEQMGLLIRENGRIRLSAEGVSVSNTVMADFL